MKKILVDGVTEQHVSAAVDSSYTSLLDIAATYSDGLIKGSASLPDSIQDLMKKSGKPEFPGSEEYVDDFSVFYDSILKD